MRYVESKVKIFHNYFKMMQELKTTIKDPLDKGKECTIRTPSGETRTIKINENYYLDCQGEVLYYLQLLEDKAYFDKFIKIPEVPQNNC